MTFDRTRRALVDESRLLVLFEQSPAAMVACVRGTRIGLLSDRVLELSGYLRNELLGVDLVEFVHPDDIVAALDGLAVSRATGRSTDLSVRLRFADGDYHTLRIGCRQLEDGVIIVTLDPATEEKYSEVRRRLDGESLLERVNERFINSRPDDLGASVDWAIQRVGSFLGADRGYVALIDHGGIGFHSVHEWRSGATPSIMDRSPWGRLEGYEASFERLIEGKAVLHRDPARLRGAWGEDRAAYRADGITSSTILPFSIDGRLAGVMGFDWVTNYATWTTRDVPVLRSLASSFGQLFVRARADAEMARTLEHSEARFRSLADNLPAPIVRFALDSRPVISNRAARRLFGDDLASRNDDDALLSRSLRRVAAQAVAAGEVRTIEHEITIDGELRFFQTRMLPETGLDGTVETVLMVCTDMTERRATEKELSRRASTDPLTGLLNRSAFLAELTGALGRSDGGRGTAVLFCDLDRFKVVNDSLGHGSGDRLLIAVASRLRSATGGDHTLARLGGDEFTVLIESTSPERDANRVAQSVLAALEEPVTLDGRDLSVSASIGIAVGTSVTRPDDVLRRADAAMYRAKDGGRARVATFDAALADAVSKRLDLDLRLRRALERDEFRVVYQPEVDLATGAVLGAEALLRWEHDGQLQSAGDFIEIAEETGLIVPIGAWILREATRQAAVWIARDPEAEFTIRVNLSARQFDQPGLTALVAETLAASGLHPSRLCLEITETALMANADAAQQALVELSDLGVSLAIDDFGTGYSSLAYLKKFPVDVLKIDRTFVDGLPDDADDVAIVSTIIRLAESLEMTVTGEGVETPEQSAELQRLGCRRAQGFLFARPASPEVFESFIDRRLPSRL